MATQKSSALFRRLCLAAGVTSLAGCASVAISARTGQPASDELNRANQSKAGMFELAIAAGGDRIAAGVVIQALSRQQFIAVSGLDRKTAGQEYDDLVPQGRAALKIAENGTDATPVSEIQTLAMVGPVAVPPSALVDNGALDRIAAVQRQPTRRQALAAMIFEEITAVDNTGMLPALVPTADTGMRVNRSDLAAAVIKQVLDQQSVPKWNSSSAAAVISNAASAYVTDVADAELFGRQLLRVGSANLSKGEVGQAATRLMTVQTTMATDGDKLLQAAVPYKFWVDASPMRQMAAATIPASYSSTSIRFGRGLKPASPTF